MLVVVYGKAVDDKEIGVYIDGIFFGGIAETKTEANLIARQCINNTHGGVAIIKILTMGPGVNLLTVFNDAVHRFAKIEKEMVETEMTLEANARRTKKPKKNVKEASEEAL